MSIFNEMLQYVSQEYSRNDINSETGIPLSTMSYVINDKRDLPGQYRESLTILYNQTVYNRLTTLGVISYDATSYMGHSPDDVIALEDDMMTVYDNLTVSILSQTAYNDDIEIDQQYIDDNYQEIYNQVVTNIQDHPKPVEYIRETYL